MATQWLKNIVFSFIIGILVGLLKHVINLEKQKYLTELFLFENE